MSDAVISVKGLCKSYLIGHRADAGPATFREMLMRNSGALGRTALDLLRGHAVAKPERREEFWALKDVSLDVMRGEVLGIVGRNGAGKSTLLKILSRITEPTRGRITLRGRVGSLLEVGTGFHPELSGRENIFLNGAILGMSRAEIYRKFDEIVEFADVAKFLDTPVKRYSSGMYVRLAFAVAAHLEPEILVVDEVLAVGDAQFQRKCLGKMKDVASGGRTVLFVSHNLSAVSQLTNRTLLLDSGAVRFVGPTADAVALYTQSDPEGNTTSFDVDLTPRKYPGTGAARVVRLRFDRPAPVFDPHEAFEYVATVRALEDIPRMRFSMTIFALDGMPVGSSFGPDSIELRSGQVADVRLAVPDLRLAPGQYYCGLSIGKGNHRTGHLDFDVVHDTLHFEVRSERGEAGTVAFWTRGWGSIVFPEMRQVTQERR